MIALEDLKSFDLSEERGFLPVHDPATELPRAFAVWDEVARDLPKLLLSGRVRRRLRSLPALPEEALPAGAPLRRAMLVLSYLGHAYVWGEPEPADHVPASIAAPWCAIAARLGRPPVLSYASYALDNWRLFDRRGALELGNLAIVQNFLGGADEDWFILIHVEIEARAARVLRALGPACAAAARGDALALADRLAELASGIESLCATLQRMPEHCDPYVYYRRVRPYIHGWKNHPLLPHGVVYEGVARFGEKPQLFRGETGAQSGIVPALDAALGVAHADDPLRAYLLEMRDYMPPRHRAFVEAAAAAPSIRAAVQASGARELVEVYDECLRWLESFRSTHLDYAARYIYRQSQSDAANPTAVGTGGTPFMPYLRKHRDETAQTRLESPGR
jgi:indoleamine 2,3-dioxygenase